MMTRWTALLLSVCLAFAAGGCTPITVSATLFADDSRLSEATVETERGAEADIAQIDIRGLIADREGGGLLFPGTNPVDDLTSRLRKAERDPGVKAVIIRINSPGGTVTASDILYREVRRFARESKKPVVASLGEVAASGGYYLALSADRIVAEPTAITGSIGVIIPTVNISEGLGRIGIRSRSIVSRPNKDLANPLEPIREEHYAVLQAIVDEYYARFRELVVERRGEAAGHGSDETPAAELYGRKRLDASRLNELTDGRVMTGARAYEAGLVDGTGGIHEAFDLAKKLAGLKAANLIKYYRQDEDKPRSPYARSDPSPTGQSEINLFQIRMNAPGLPGAESAGAYYLWIPPGG